MSKWIRGILYITAGCAGIGCAALILGLVLGRNSDKTLFQLGERIQSAVSRAEDRMHQWSEDRRQEQAPESSEVIPIYQEDAPAGERAEITTGVLSVDAGQVKQLHISLRHGYLEIVEGDSDQIHVELSEPMDDIDVTCQDNKIKIQDNRQGSVSRKDVSIFMEVPDHQQFEHIKIQINAGLMDIECPLQADHMELTADAGEITAEDLQADKFTASVGAGVIDIDEGVFGNMKMDCGLGEIDLGGASVSADAEIKCGMGTVDVELADDTDSVNYALSCGLGSIEIGDESYSSISREKKINNGAAVTFTLDCGMGTITID